MKPEIETTYWNNNNVWYIRYVLNDKFHREDGPAYVSYYYNGNIESEIYYLSGKCHRENGPSEIYYDINGNIRDMYYYLNGNELNESEFILYNRKRKLKNIL